ncbi:MAG TPA: PHP-associated domain-containing protein, partial [Armatimonadota bacterium]|nr:PHP-associated domain-containing protein [Armatimonadota bacterium]
ERLLLASTELPIDEIVSEAEARSGIAIPAHVDRRGYGLYGVLGFIPEGVNLPAVEISRRSTEQKARQQHPDLEGRAVITSSDAHMLADIGSCRTVFQLEHRSVQEIKLAFERLDGRCVEECRTVGGGYSSADSES